MRPDPTSPPFTEVTDFVRFPLILGIILLHSDILTDVSPSAEMSLWSLDLVRLLSGIMTRSCVPLFFAISGYLFFLSGRFSVDIYSAKMRRRVRSLLVPYLLWNTLGLILYLLKRTPWLEERFSQYHSIPLDLPAILEGFWAIPGIPYPYDFVLWFIRDLILVVAIATPLVWIAARGLGAWGLGAVTLIMISGMMPWGLTEALYFFYLGAYASIRRVDCNRLIHSLRWLPLLWLSLSVGLLFVSEDSLLLQPLFFTVRLVGVPALLALGQTAIMHGLHIPRFLARSTFFIYAFHGLMVSVVRKGIIAAISPDGNFGYLASYLLTFVTLTSVSLTAFVICRRLVPRLTTLATGGRN